MRNQTARIGIEPQLGNHQTVWTRPLTTSNEGFAEHVSLLCHVLIAQKRCHASRVGNNLNGAEITSCLQKTGESLAGTQSQFEILQFFKLRDSGLLVNHDAARAILQRGKDSNNRRLLAAGHQDLIRIRDPELNTFECHVLHNRCGRAARNDLHAESGLRKQPLLLRRKEPTVLGIGKPIQGKRYFCLSRRHGRCLLGFLTAHRSRH